MAASANSGRPALSSIPGTATIAATAVVARPNLNSALIGKRIDGPLDTLALGPICHKGFALPLCLRRHFEEKLNQSFKKLVISGTATVFGSRVEALPLCGPRSPAALYGLAAARVVANRRAGGPDSIRDPANGGRGKIGRRDSAGTRRAHDRSGKPGRKYFSGGGKFCSGRRDLDQWRPAECALSCMCLIVGGPSRLAGLCRRTYVVQLGRCRRSQRRANKSGSCCREDDPSANRGSGEALHGMAAKRPNSVKSA